MHAGVHNKACF